MKLLKTALVITTIVALIFFITANKPPMENNFDEKWKQVDSLVSLSQPRTALDIVEVIHASAKADENPAQVIKANLYRIKLMAEFEEEHLVKAIGKIKLEIETANFPEKELLHSILGDLYLRYFQQNSYQILDRGRLQDFSGDDLQTWDAALLLKTAEDHFLASIQSAADLQKIDLKAFSAILTEQKDSKLFRPTLFDFLAHRAIEFYLSGESGITLAADQWKPDHADYFAAAGRFINIEIPENKKQTHAGRIVSIYQDLIRFHLSDKDPQALIDADLARLNSIYASTTLENSDGLYQNALTHLYQKFLSSPHSASVAFELAQFHNQQANNFDNQEAGDEFRWERKKAVDICQEAIQKFPDSKGAENCRILLDEMVRPSVSIQTEGAAIPGKPSVGLLNWKNYGKLYFRVVKMDYREYQRMTFRIPQADVARQLINRQPLQSWTLDVPNEMDYQQHNTEFKFPALNEGFYVMIVSGNELFQGSDFELAWVDFWATNLSFISQGMETGGHEVFVLDREKGAPLNGVTVRAFTRDYDYQTREYRENPYKTYTTDRNGYFKMDPESSAKSKSVSIEFLNKSDSFYPATSFYLNAQRKSEPRAELRTFFFTDRAIYRPGQTVYFKAILLEKTGDKQEIKAGHFTRIEFFDVNYQLVSALDLTTNDYGAVNGAFTIPNGILNGMMTLRSSSGSVTFRVEDYKRPTFEVTFEPVKGSYKLNTEVTLNGMVKGYAGNAIDGAGVKYRVMRRSTFPFRWLYGRNFFPNSPEVELISGETTTDNNGNFTVTFNATPDNSFSRNYKPVFQYTIHASVTDVSGETQAGEQTVSVGYDALFLNVEIPEKLDKTGKQQFTLEAVNFSGEKQETNVKVEISKLKDPGVLMVSRLWGDPDVFVLDEKSFKTDFPNRIFANENNPEKWEAEAIVFSKNFDTKNDTVLNPENLRNWKSGKYSVKMTATDVFGNAVETLKYFTLFSPSDSQPPLTEYNWFTPLKSSGEPGEQATFLIGTAARNVKALYEVQHRGKTIKREWLSLDREQRLIEVPILEEYRGGFSVQIIFVMANREFENLMIVDVPFTNKQLDLAFETFRSQLEPGSREEWKVTIRSKNGDLVAARMLASMFDASLDAFARHGWSFDLYQQYNQTNPWQTYSIFEVSMSNSWDFGQRQYRSYIFNQYDRLNWFGYEGYGHQGYYMKDGLGVRMAMANEAPEAGMAQEMIVSFVEDDVEISSEIEAQPTLPDSQPQFEGMQVRRDFNETAFFYPELQTNEQGEVVIRFKLPESFTRWRFMGLGYTKDLMTGMLEQEFTASKKLMVTANAPRFFRMGDTLHFSSRITNLSEEQIEGTAIIEFFDAVTMQPINTGLQVAENNQNFSIGAAQSTAVKWQIIIPEDYGVITYRVKAIAGNYTDGEEKSIPVLPNRMLVTESVPMSISGIGSKSFSFEKLINSGKSSTLKHHNLTLEFSSNPAWYAIQALPVISEPTHKNALSIFAAFYSNSIAFYISNENPKIRRVFESWKTQSPETFLSNLEKNQELKALIMDQTPWVLQASNEAERKQRIQLLFDLNIMNERLDASIRTLQQMQSPNGGFPWFEGMPESRYITQNVVEGLGKLHKMGIIDAVNDERVNRIITQAVRYLEERIREDYEEISKRNKDKMDENYLSATHIQFLYARSFFPHIMMNPNSETAFNFFKQQAGKYWQQQNIYLQGMIAVALNRNENKEVPALIIRSLKERSLTNEEMGLYWKSESGYYWYQAPIETQAMMIEAFDEVAGDTQTVELMKIWLLKQKQTQDWKTSRATVEAVYALLRRGEDLLARDKLVEIEMAGEMLNMKEVGQVEAGTGYFQKSWGKGEIKPEMGNITVTKTDEGIAWGAVYWQYFENLEKITPHETPLSLKKQLFVERNHPSGTVLEQLNDGDNLKVGDKVIVRIELRVDRDMEYVHMKDMRASAFEPVNVLSGYKYRGGLGYYESTRDAATNFFFDYLRKGTYVFEYPLVASQTGNFSNGISTIQCMYAPEFSSHSQGIRVVVE